MRRLVRSFICFVPVILLVSFALIYITTSNWTRRSEEKWQIVSVSHHHHMLLDCKTCDVTTPHNLSRDQSPLRYVIGLNYWEQTNMALGNMFALNRVAYDWNARLICPFTMDSRLYGLPHLVADHKWRELPPNETMLPLKHVFNVDYLNMLGRSYHLLPLVDFKHFLLKGYRQVIVMHFIHSHESRERKVLIGGPAGEELFNRLKEEYVFECHDLNVIKPILNDIITSLNEHVKYSTNPFIVSKYYCVDASVITSPHELAEKCHLNTSMLSLMVLNWRGIHDNNGIVVNTAIGLHKSKRLLIQGVTLKNHPRGSTDIFRHSWRVLITASNFIKSLNLIYNNFIAIHIRSEKLGQRNSRINKYTVNCLLKAMDVVNSLKLNRELRTIVMTDYGTYGSDSCLACKGAKQISEVLEKYNIQPIHFNPLEYQTTDDAGFVAAVEMEVLVKAKYVVLIGGGAFQKQIAMHKYKYDLLKRRDSAIKVCWEDEIKTQFFERHQP